MKNQASGMSDFDHSSYDENAFIVNEQTGYKFLQFYKCLLSNYNKANNRPLPVKILSSKEYSSHETWNKVLQDFANVMPISAH
jgi:hypothetical protein